MNRLTRRHLRDRKIRRRLSKFKQFNYHTDNPGRLAKKSGLGCPDGKKCRLCHPTKRQPTHQETHALLELNDYQKE